MSAFAVPRDWISENRNREVIPFQPSANSARQTLPQETWCRGGTAPGAERDNILVVRNDGQQNARICGEYDRIIIGRSS